MLKKICGILKLYTVYAIVGVIGYFAFDHIYVKFDINIPIYIFDKIWMNETLFIILVFSIVDALVILFMHKYLYFNKTKFYILKLLVVYIIGIVISVFTIFFLLAVSFALSMRGMG